MTTKIDVLQEETPPDDVQHRNGIDSAKPKTAKVIVVGVGHIGLPTALVLALQGHHVVGTDINRDLIKALKQGISPFMEDGATDRLQRMEGCMSFTSDLGELAEPYDAAVICVDAPSVTGGEVDLSRLEAAVHSVTPFLAEGGHVALRSTIPPGTTARLAEEVARRRPGSNLFFSHVPEFMRQGTAIGDTEKPWRIVIGADSGEAGEGARVLFQRAGAPIEVMPTRAAEMAKYAANAYLALRVSYANMLAELSEALGVNFDDVRRALGHDPRIGREFFVPGLGYGGPCLPKDLNALRRISTDAGVDDALLEATWSINERARTRVADAIVNGLRSGDRVAILGLSFKGATLGLRDSPAMTLAVELAEQGLSVVAFEPATDESGTVHGVRLAATAVEAAAGAKAIVIATDWAEFIHTDWAAVAAVAPEAVVLDCRCLLEPEAIEGMGLRYFRTGRGHNGAGLSKQRLNGVRGKNGNASMECDAGAKL